MLEAESSHPLKSLNAIQSTNDDRPVRKLAATVCPPLQGNLWCLNLLDSVIVKIGLNESRL